MARTFLRLWMGRMMSGLCCSSITIRFMAVFWLNSRKEVGAAERQGRGRQVREGDRSERETG